MSKQTYNTTVRRLAITTAASALLGLGVITSEVQAAPVGAQSSSVEAPLILAATDGMERRDERRDDRQDNRGGRSDDRQDNRGDRRDTRQDCRDEEGVGKDKRDCKQEDRKERHQEDKD